MDQIDGVVHRLVCNYAPSGNVIGKPAYLQGEPCSKCDNNSVCDYHYPGLCVGKIDQNEGLAEIRKLLKIIVAKETVEAENRLRELVKSVKELVKRRSANSGQKDDNKSSKANEFSYTDVIVEYLAKAHDYHDRVKGEFSNGSRFPEELHKIFESIKETNTTLKPGMKQFFSLFRITDYILIKHFQDLSERIISTSSHTNSNTEMRKSDSATFIFRSASPSFTPNLPLTFFFFVTFRHL